MHIFVFIVLSIRAAEAVMHYIGLGGRKTLKTWAYPTNYIGYNVPDVCVYNIVLAIQSKPLRYSTTETF